MSSNVSAAASKPFRFIVGPNQREFTIHAAIVAKQSRYLETLVNGPMIEATEGKVNWGFVDEDTFVRFWQFAYTGGYDVWDEPSDQMAAGSVAQVEEPLPEREPDPEPEPLGKFYTRAQWIASNAPPKNEVMRRKFVELRQTGYKPFLSHRRSEMHAGSDAKHLLSHAKLYVFADCYGIELLMLSSYNKLHQSLSNLVLRPEAAKAVAALTQYCLETNVPDVLKELVIVFVGFKYENLLANERFGELLDAHGDFAEAVLKLSRCYLL